MSAKKQFFLTVPMNAPQNVKKVTYTFEENPAREGVKIESCFPGIALLKQNISKGDDIEVVVLWTDKPTKSDESQEYSDSITNLNTFYDEINQLSSELGIDIRSKCKELIIPFDETKKKQMVLFKQICESYSSDSYLYVDFTYGTKMSIINIFSSIVYAEKVADCYIKELVYGSVDFVSNVGHIFDVRSLYEINTLIQSASNIPNVNMKHIFDLFEE